MSLDVDNSSSSRGGPPVIEPVDFTNNRPAVSVMLPVYEPDRYLAQALQSVLSQDLGPNRMQIAVVDDASERSDVRAIVADTAPQGRVEIHRAERNRGLADNWNACVRIARGEIVHILHQDDWILDGFYERMLPAFAAHPEIGMAFCRHAFVDGDGRVTRRSHRERWRAGPLRGWLRKISRRQRLQCAAALVRRSVYETLGGYRSDLCYALDWELWVRIAAHFRVWYEPRILACYRRHAQSETARLRQENKIARDVLRAIDAFADHLPADERAQLLSAAYASFARRTLKQLAGTAAQADEMAERLDAIKLAISRTTDQRALERKHRQQTARLEQIMSERRRRESA